jgi:hypothetical protein
VQISILNEFRENPDFKVVVACVASPIVLGFILVGAFILGDTQERRCQNAVSASEEVVNRATTENAIIGLARNSNGEPAPSAYRPGSRVDQAIARVRRECFAQQLS